MLSGSNSQELTSHELLTQQHQQLTALGQIISNEKQILQQHDPQALLTISQEKNTQLVAIQQLDQKISQHQGFAQDKAAGKLTQQLAEITVLLKSCQQKNLVNGQIIQQSQLAVERMKTSLLESHNKNAITYNSKGKKSAGLSSIGLKA
ncbi:flagellar biosynthesis protein FlgN [Colwellia sp. MT41]|uniref:Flagellar protein FlgN n=1 Tax=Colwellia marinimaniae TaxID=1513592 RepID=A0ABQ0MZU2_9GAMM|nr:MULTISPECIES: flagellar export chaperone FlgN [Colwellia]ALO34254.1 flagellar biosynthesis protein FlgN [Colwellia sp. MT41]GAW97870.1 flagellar protein FlgN [Colwellia marinimaniae]